MSLICISGIVSVTVSLLLFGKDCLLILQIQWAIIELTRFPEKQVRLRKELLELSSEPTYDEMTSGLPYLEAVFRESIRLHPPVGDTTRVVGVTAFF